MNFLDRLIKSIDGKVLIFASVFLLFNMLILVSNVIVRIWGGVVRGQFELAELSIGLALAFAFSHTTLLKGHVSVKFLVERLPSLVRTILDKFNTLVSLIFWGTVAWSSYGVFLERMAVGEITQQLRLSILPVRFIWILGVLFVCLILIRDLVDSRRLKDGND